MADFILEMFTPEKQFFLGRAESFVCTLDDGELLAFGQVPAVVVDAVAVKGAVNRGVVGDHGLQTTAPVGDEIPAQSGTGRPFIHHAHLRCGPAEDEFVILGSIFGGPFQVEFIFGDAACFPDVLQGAALARLCFQGEDVQLLFHHITSLWNKL